MNETSKWRLFDYLLLASALCLAGVGALLIYSAIGARQSLHGDVFKHILFTLAGLIVVLIATRVDYRWLSSFAWLLYAGGLLALMAVFVVGTTVGGAKRWIFLGPFSVQPSEFVKLIVIVALARLLSGDPRRSEHLGHYFLSLLVALVPALLVYQQPDLGTAMIFGVIWLVMVFVAGAPLRYLVLTGAAVAAALPLAMLTLHGYMRERIAIFLDPMTDPFGAGYNVIQSRISVGSGQLWGRGLFQGSQTQLDFLRVQHRDFIFAVLGEELGFIGSVLVLAAFILLLFRAISIATRARDLFGQHVAVGISAFILFQTFVNVGMIIGLLPITGVPLPFISYGGTALLTMFACIGVLESIAVHSRVKTYASPLLFRLPVTARLRTFLWSPGTARRR